MTRPMSQPTGDPTGRIRVLDTARRIGRIRRFAPAHFDDALGIDGIEMQEIAAVFPVNADAAQARDIANNVFRRNGMATTREVAHQIADALYDDLVRTATLFFRFGPSAKIVDGIAWSRGNGSVT